MLELNDLRKTYPGGRQALRGISMTVPTGIFGLLGPNGAGKSTLMRTLVTLQPPDRGSVRLDGQDVLADPRAARARIGYLPQDFGLHAQVSAERLLDHLAVYKGLADARQRRARVQACLEQVNLWQHRAQPLGGFSGGMRQRFGLAQALLNTPRLLVVDEPTAGLDPAERLRLHDLLSALGEQHIVLLSTHLVEDVLALCTAVAVISDGTLRCQGDPQDLVQSLHGQVWQHSQRAADAAPVEDTDVDPPLRLLNQRLRRGQRLRRVLAPSPPGPDWVRAEPDLEDVYFSALQCSDPLRAGVSP